MTVDNTLTTTTLTDQRLSEEVEKLRLETAKLRNLLGRSPTTLIALGTLALSLFANLVQYQTAKTSAAAAGRQQQLAELAKPYSPAVGRHLHLFRGPEPTANRVP
jgi:hypothetical protein